MKTKLIEIKRARVLARTAAIDFDSSNVFECVYNDHTSFVLTERTRRAPTIARIAFEALTLLDAPAREALVELITRGAAHQEQ